MAARKRAATTPRESVPVPPTLEERLAGLERVYGPLTEHLRWLEALAQEVAARREALLWASEVRK